MKRFAVAVAVCAVVFGVSTATHVALAGGPKPKLPDGMKGFCGVLQGKVLGRSKYGFVLKVQKVVRVWEDNEARSPRSAVGKKLLINAQWEKGPGGKWRPVAAHMKFIRSLKTGGLIKIEVINDEGERLHILELSEEQRKRAAKQAGEEEGEEEPGRIEAGEPTYKKKSHRAWRHKGRIVGLLRNAPDAFLIEALNSAGKVVKSTKGEKNSYEMWLVPGVYSLRVRAKGYKTLLVERLTVKSGHDLVVSLEFTAKGEEESGEEEEEETKKPKPELPDGMKGFCGVLEGKVVGKFEHGFLLKVRRVVRLWKGNKAKNPRSAVGKELLINVQWEKGRGGKWRPVAAHVKFVRSLKKGEKIRIEVINDEGERLHILELSEEQLRRAGVRR